MWPLQSLIEVVDSLSFQSILIILFGLPTVYFFIASCVREESSSKRDTRSLIDLEKINALQHENNKLTVELKNSKAIIDQKESILKEKNDKIDDLESERFSLLRLASNVNSSSEVARLKNELDDAINILQSRDIQNSRLSAELNATKKELSDVKSRHNISDEWADPFVDPIVLYENIALLEDTLSHYLHASIDDLRKETWKEILSRRGSARFNLDDYDRLSIHFPVFHPERVFYAAATGKRFHSVPWCYSLDTAQTVNCCSYDVAKNDLHYLPCRLCVGDLPDEEAL